MANPDIEDKDLITIDEAIEYWHFGTGRAKKYFQTVTSADYLVYYGKTKRIIKAEFEKHLQDNPDLKGELTYGKKWKRRNQT